jgi:methionyl-tRNA synthetase
MTKDYITIDDFHKVEITIGKILEVDIVEDADRLLKLKVDLGEEGPRQIISGIREFFEDPQELVGKRVPFATNLQPRTIKGLESNGMIVAVSDKEGNGFSLLEAGENISPGSKIS